ncbi:MAG: hypothetical protein V4654_00400 [Bdellovibrionota bacterium]
MKKWYTILKQAFFKSNTQDFYYLEELRNFEEKENLRRSQYLSSFSKAA